MFCCMFKHAGAQVSKKHQKFLNLVIPTKPLSLSVVSILAWLSWDRLLLPRPCGPNLREEHPLCSKTSPNSNLPCPWPPKSMSPVFYCNWTVTKKTRGILYFREFFSYRFSSLETTNPKNNQPVWWICTNQPTNQPKVFEHGETNGTGSNPLIVITEALQRSSFVDENYPS